jgi:predicted amidohydrolase
MARAKGLKVGIGQLPVVMGDKAANVRTIHEAVEWGAHERCDLVALPECSLAGWLSSAARRAAEPIPGPLTRRLGALARKHRVAIVLGMEEREGGRIYNSAVLIDRSGRLVLRHRKINELDIGLEVYSRGESLAVADLEGRKVAVDICADSWSPEVTDTLHFMGARVILSPSAWAVDPGSEETNIAWIRETYRARAKGRELWIVAPDGVGPVTEGPWKGRVLQGNSLVTGPDGKIVLQGPTNAPAFLTVQIP